MKTIYGDCNSCSGGGAFGAIISISELFSLLTPAYNGLLDAVKIVIQKLLVFKLEGHGISTIVGDLGVLAHLPFVLAVRYGWKSLMPGVKFDQYNEAHTDLLIDLYLINGEDWREDPLFKPKDPAPQKVEGCST